METILKDRRLLMITMIKVTDIGHSAKRLDYHKLWTDRIVEEFFLQGDAERDEKLPISAFMDRKKDSRKDKYKNH